MASNTRTRREGGHADTRNDRLSEAYFRWLVGQVQEDGHQRNTYWDLLQVLFRTEFIWRVANDDNRIVDGLDLRVEFLKSQRRRGDPENLVPLGPFCSVLEVLVGISRRLAWLAEGSPEGWAWQLLCNLELHKFRDPLSERKIQKVEEVLHALIWRHYDPDGVGGFFPLARPTKDQTEVEIWYQMHAYAMEIHPEY
jgi:hypothetical protein